MSGLDELKSRFMVDTDARIDHLIFDLPKSWWSRPYEYAWCASFAWDGAVVLDAACGISHPFKFFLGERCRLAYACDQDARINSTAEIVAEVRANIGEKAAVQAAARIRPGGPLHLAQANLAALPYEDACFDLIYCISVLEHLSVNDCLQALKEFHRTLKPSGKLILTFDYPTVNLEILRRQMDEAGLEYMADVDYNLPPNAVHSTMWGDLYVFRAALRRRVQQG